MTGLFALAALICVHAETPQEVCAPYTVKSFVSIEACEKANNNLDGLIMFVGRQDTQTGITATCMPYDPALDRTGR
jgi:hypothetical protein